MARRRAAIEYQQQLAQKKLEKYEAKLKDRKVDAARFRYDPLWRHLNSKLAQLKLQLKSVEKRESFKKS
ncbi:hypothetical protein [Pseudobacteriovorax antillogorgiicola]|uniref:Uncharacterized protein n=1 Tax=Pseudobacteriovorax antillogorgiicola TaxID=1513793 RepID=A0A1Y6CHK5_9BACT|nr:hypothetical protein [Pseudobacteriovorax antillogorgiicola]TCS48345.1 hypothetical protein EDD56_118125 [Pseudobacteriovorax antillogorgiicola]SMF56330.1 hypothetical protein SAMN06296036_11816 [Pseudobacteriovorax antillogorgiicola]